MQVKVVTQDGVLIMRFEGNLDTGTSMYAESETNKYLKDYSKVIMDLSETNFVSSAGLRVFLTTAKRLLAVDGILRLCNANEVVAEVLEVSGFHNIIEVKTTLQEALDGLKS